MNTLVWINKGMVFYNSIASNLRHKIGLIVFLAIVMSGVNSSSFAQQSAANWIWGKENPETGEAFFVRRFKVADKPVKATLRVTADDFFVLVVNGKFLLFSENWRSLRNVDLTHLIRKGENRIEIKAKNSTGAAGLLGWLDIEFEN